MATRFNISLSFRKKLIFLRKKAQTGPFWVVYVSLVPKDDFSNSEGV
jgi:hypothetical protein